MTEKHRRRYYNLLGLKNTYNKELSDIKDKLHEVDRCFYNLDIDIGIEERQTRHDEKFKTSKTKTRK